MKMIEIIAKLDNIHEHCDIDFQLDHFGADNFEENYGVMRMAVYTTAAALGGIYKELPPDPREFRVIIRNQVLNRHTMDESEKKYWQFLNDCYNECLTLAGRFSA